MVSNNINSSLTLLREWEINGESFDRGEQIRPKPNQCANGANGPISSV
ncbi:hypothetical protein CCACVL1_20649 [Corchorus capsularis]|uniref:Uncharacterized protein n=1 Tax=Corchorus capsularis TaxID=210143 RepID=A0A1R3HA84_COCAP|nr:hypothetical protein CCACVL1_20649 [Corchorus capsularis]